VHVAVDRHSRPVALVVVEAPSPADAGLEGGAGQVAVRPLTSRSSLGTSLRDMALQAMTRPAAYRYDPIVCTSEDGHYLGIVRVDRLLVELASTEPALREPAKELQELSGHLRD
jgi:hypothetical protein